MASPVDKSPTETRAYGAAGAVSRAEIARAFSLRRNLRALAVPPAGAAHLRPLDGLRALSILWVVLFHAGWYSFMVLPVPRYAEVLLARPMLPIWRGDFGVDTFFVISGFLVGGMLLDEHADTGRIRFVLFYVRRLMRLWPALAVALVLNHVVIGDPWSTAWRNLFYLSNFFGVLGTGMAWTWSLAIEEQFYLVCPWIVLALARLREGVRLAALAAGIAIVCALGIAIAHAGGFFAWDTEIALNRPLPRWADAFDTLYSKPWMRAGPLLAGVGVAVCYRMPRVMDKLARARWIGGLGLVVAFALAGVATHWPLAVGAPRAIELLYIGAYRSLFGVAVAYVLLLAVSKHPAGAAMGRVLGARALYPIGQLAYSAYLVNPFVAMGMHRVLADRVVASTASPMLTFMPVDMVLTFALAAVLYLLVERPLMNLRPR